MPHRDHKFRTVPRGLLLPYADVTVSSSSCLVVSAPVGFGHVEGLLPAEHLTDVAGVWEGLRGRGEEGVGGGRAGERRLVYIVLKYNAVVLPI